MAMPALPAIPRNSMRGAALIYSICIFWVSAMCRVLFLEPPENKVDSALTRLMLSISWFRSRPRPWKENWWNSSQKAYLKNAVFTVRFLSPTHALHCLGCRALRGFKRSFYRGVPGPCLRSAVGRDKKGIQVSPSRWDTLSTVPLLPLQPSSACIRDTEERGCVLSILRRPWNSYFWNYMYWNSILK